MRDECARCVDGGGGGGADDVEGIGARNGDMINDSSSSSSSSMVMGLCTTDPGTVCAMLNNGRVR